MGSSARWNDLGILSGTESRAEWKSSPRLLSEFSCRGLFAGGEQLQFGATGLRLRREIVLFTQPAINASRN